MAPNGVRLLETDSAERWRIVADARAELTASGAITVRDAVASGADALDFYDRMQVPSVADQSAQQAAKCHSLH